MARVIGIRVLRLIFTLFVVSGLSFFMISALPGDKVNLALGGAPANAEQYERVKEELGLNDPIPVRYVEWISNAFSGDLGQSYLKNEEVSTLMSQRIPITLELAFVALFLAAMISIPLGVISAYRAGKKEDIAISGASIVLLSTPSFILGTGLIYLVGVKLGWLPFVGWVRISDSFSGNLKSVALPALSLALVEVGFYVRVLRTDMITTLQNDFIETARAKGLSNRRILFRHALRPSSLSFITVLGLNAGALLGGTVVIEQMFAMPGLGKSLLEAVISRDLLLAQGIVLFLSVVYVVINFVVDLVYMAVDPRIRDAKV